MTNDLLLYTSFILMVGLISLIKSASIVINCTTDLLVAFKIIISSFLSSAEHWFT